MNTNNTKQMPKYKIIYSLRVRQQLREKGFEPLLEIDNEYKPGFKCWRYLNTEEFAETLSEILRGGRRDG
jgi:hypothetical protein